VLGGELLVLGGGEFGEALLGAGGDALWRGTCWPLVLLVGSE
jgi:hypothetical protein